MHCSEQKTRPLGQAVKTPPFHGGNLSYRLKAEEVEMIRPRLNAPGEWTPIGTEVPGLAGEFFLVTGSGKYFRNIIVDPEVCLAIIELDETGCNYLFVGDWSRAEDRQVSCRHI